MLTYVIIVSMVSFIIGLCKVLSLRKLIRFKQHKKLYPEATLKDIESFEKNTMRNFAFRVVPKETNSK